MTDTVQTRVLEALKDGRTRYVSSIRSLAGCDAAIIESMSGNGLARFPDVSRGGRTVCITPKGLATLIRQRRREGKFN